jgi:hypothetical protein
MMHVKPRVRASSERPSDIAEGEGPSAAVSSRTLSLFPIAERWAECRHGRKPGVARETSHCG